MKQKLYFMFFLLFAFLSFFLYADEKDEFSDEDGEREGLQFDFGGKIESVHGIGVLREGDYIASRNFVNAFLQMSLYNSYAKISATAEYNYTNKQRTGFRLNEAYYKYSNSIFELSIGRQQIVWGQADGFALTNIIAAKDTREFTAVTNDDSFLPSDAIRMKFFHNIFTFDAVVIPLFTPNILPPFSFELGKNKPPFYIDNFPSKLTAKNENIPIEYSKGEAKLPRHVLDTEVGTRFSFFLPKIDFSFSAFYGWDRTPMFVREGDIKFNVLGKKMSFGDLSKMLSKMPPLFLSTLPKPSQVIDISITPEYYRIAMIGTDGAIPIKDVLLRYEAAYIWGRYFEPLEQMGMLPKMDKTDATTWKLNFNKPLRKHQLLLLAALDWNRDGWSLSCQYFEDLILDHKDDIKRPLHQGTVSLNISKTLLRDTLRLGVVGAIGINYGDTFSTYSIDYAITDNLHIATGFDLYTKGYEGKGHFSSMKDLSSFWLRGRFSF